MTRKEGKVILVVDDDPILLDVVAEILTAHGHETVCCSDVQSACEILLQRSDVCTLVTDDMIGHEHVGAQMVAFAREQFPELGCVVMSGYVNAELAEQVGMGVTLLQKPMSMHQLLAAID